MDVWNSPPVPQHLLIFSLLWQLAGFLLALGVNLRVAGIYFIMFWMSVAYSHSRVRFKGQPALALLTIMRGQGVFPFYAGWATIRGEAVSGLLPHAMIAALAASLIIGGFNPLTQLYQLEADARRGDRTVARGECNAHFGLLRCSY